MEKEQFKPYVPDNKNYSELSIVSVIIGIVIAVAFGGANAYLGLRLGMTVSASIPAAVISMGVLRIILRRKSILENNMVQTIGSAGESLAAGVIFTVPALFMWAKEYSDIDVPGLLTVTLMAFFGGILGVTMMIPLRRFLIVQEHGKLLYPEGTACADILMAGETGGSKALKVFAGLGAGTLYKVISDGFKLFPSEVEWELPGYKNGAIGADVQPALLGVGFIIGPKIAAYMLAGAVLAWLGFIPLITIMGEHSSATIPPATKLIAELDFWGIWNHYIRYIGAGAVAFAGIISLIKSLPIIVKSFIAALSGLGVSRESLKRTDRDLSIKWVIFITVSIVILIAVLPQIPSGIVGAILIALFAFFFVTVSSRIVGVVGSSSNPISGMTIATLLFTTLILKALGVTGTAGMVAAITVGGIVCIAAAIAGDTSQDLKTGFLLGATPWKQQVGEFIGVVFASLMIGTVLILFDKAYGFGSKELAAPQATLMKLVIEGVMNSNLPWGLVFTGAAASAVVELLKIPSLPFAVGLYLPIHLSTPIMIGGLIRHFVDRKKCEKEEKESFVESGILYASGLIAGEGITGILIAIAVVLGFKASYGTILGSWFSVLAFTVLVISLYYMAVKRNKTK